MIRGIQAFQDRGELTPLSVWQGPGVAVGERARAGCHKAGTWLPRLPVQRQHRSEPRRDFGTIGILLQAFGELHFGRSVIGALPLNPA